MDRGSTPLASTLFIIRYLQRIDDQSKTNSKTVLIAVRMRLGLVSRFRRACARGPYDRIFRCIG